MTLEFQPFDLPFRIRQSGLVDARCLFRFHKIHVLKQRDPDSEFALRGTDFHDLAKQYVDFLRSSKQPSDWEYGDELTNSKDWNIEAIGIFKNWIRNESFETDHIYATEYKIRMDWNLKPVDDSTPEGAKRVVFSSDLDRLDIRRTEAIIVDYKSNFMAYKPTSIQSVMYPWMVFHQLPHIETVKFQLEFVRWGIKPEAREFSRDELPTLDRYVEQQVLRLISAIEADEWPAAVNSSCAFCMLSCPLVEAGLSQEAIGQIQTDQRAAEMAQQLYALHLASQKLHSSLKNWSMRKGVIDAGNDIRLGFKKQQKWAYDPRTIMKLNSDYGFAPTRALKADSQELKKVNRDYPEYTDSVRKTGKDKSTTAFKFWNEVGDPLDQSEDDEN